jgi:acetyltransferase-like isoleucine patch superfamily enzyme
MEDILPIVVPQHGVNDDRVVISRVIPEAGAMARKGDVVLEVTTSKATFEIEAERDGYFWSIVAEGAEVDVLSTVAFLTADPERPDPKSLLADSEDGAAGPAQSGDVRATQDARELAAQHGIDLAAIGKRGIIRRRDVEAAVAGSSQKSVAHVEPDPPAGRLDPEFLELIRSPDSGFAMLSTELKIKLYRAHGAVVGNGVLFAPGAVIHADFMEVGAGCEFGAGTVIRAETLKLGDGCLFGRDNDIMCRRIEIGAMLFLVNRVLIGQGGAFNPEAELVVGHSCLISSDVLINTAHRVSIGDVSCLSPGVSIFTHSHWQNVLEGYQASFAPVTIGSDVWITGNCLVTPGVVMEDGSQALANSTIVGRVMSRTVVSGVPARKLRDVPGNLTPGARDQIMTRLWPTVEDAIRARGADPAGAVYAGLSPGVDSDALVQVAFGACPEAFSGGFFDLDAYTFTGPHSAIADEVRNVLRRHGIRFSPHDWRYRADVGRFNA